MKNKGYDKRDYGIGRGAGTNLPNYLSSLRKLLDSYLMSTIDLIELIKHIFKGPAPVPVPVVSRLPLR